MAKNEKPIFTKTPVIAIGTISVANANRDGTGAIVTIAEGGTNGRRLDILEVKAIVTTTAGMVRLYLSNDAGVTWELWVEIPVTAITASGTVAAFSYELVFTKPLSLEDTNMRLGASTENAEEMNVFIRGGDLGA